jgi:hypothetical protein
MWKSDTESRSVSCACCGDVLRSQFDRRRFLQLSAGGLALAACPPLAFAAEGNYEAMGRASTRVFPNPRSTT